MNPYEILGLPVSATRDEIESTYRALLRRHHPDLHHAEGPEAVATAEAATRRLNEAIALLRAGWLPPSGASTGSSTGGNGSRFEDRFGFHTDPATDWFGNPLDRRIRADSVDCPFCGLAFTDAVVYRSHLASDHGYGEPVVPPPPRPRRRLAERFVWLGWVPAPWLWFLVVLVAWWAAVVALFGDSPAAIVGVWVGVALYVVALSLAFRFRRRW